MESKDKNGQSKEGSSRVGIYRVRQCQKNKIRIKNEQSKEGSCRVGIYRVRQCQKVSFAPEYVSFAPE
jgi:hypothetical protein